MRRSWLGSLGAITLLAAGGTVIASTVELDDWSSTGPYTDTRPLGSVAAHPHPNAPVSPDGNGSVRMASTNGTDSQEKASAVFYDGTLGPAIGTLADLSRGGLTLDWYLEERDDATTAPYVATMGYVILTIDGPQGSAPGSTASLYWETAYQTSPPTFSEGQWYDDLDLGSGRWWAFANGNAYGQAGTPTLADWASGSEINPGWPVFDETTQVYAVSLMFGSAAGNYVAYVDDVSLTFTAIPEPASLALLGAGGLLMLRRRRGA